MLLHGCIRVDLCSSVAISALTPRPTFGYRPRWSNRNRGGVRVAIRTYILSAAAVTCGVAATARAQQPAYTPTPQPSVMPGTPVGTSSQRVVPVGTQLPQAVPSVGTPIGGGGLPGGRPATVGPGTPGGGQPQGKVIDLSNVVAPYPGMPKPAPTFWEKVERDFFGLFESAPTVQRAPNVTPGIFRRNRERHRQEELQRRLRD